MVLGFEHRFGIVDGWGAREKVFRWFGLWRRNGPDQLPSVTIGYYRLPMGYRR